LHGHGARLLHDRRGSRGVRDHRQGAHTPLRVTPAPVPTFVHPAPRPQLLPRLVVPPEPEAWPLLLEYLLDQAPAPGLGDPFRLDHEQASRLRRHVQAHLLQRDSKPDSNSAMMSPGGGLDVATADVTRVLDEAAVRYELLAHAHTETATAEADALGLAAAD